MRSKGRKERRLGGMGGLKKPMERGEKWRKVVFIEKGNLASGRVLASAKLDHRKLGLKM